MAIGITKKTGTANTTAASGRSIKYIVVHYTATTSSASGKAASVASTFANSSNKASADFICDDSSIVQYNPDVANRYTWHCGGSKLSTKGGSLYGIVTNKNSIGVEICSTNSSGTVKDANDSTWSFTSAALSKTKTLIAYLMEEYGIDSDYVVRHYDVNGKLCPGVVGWNADSGSETKWKSFKSGLVTSSSSSSTAQTATQSAASKSSSLAGTYTVTASSGLNMRNGAGTGYSIMVVLPKGTSVKCYGYYTAVSGVKWLYVQTTYNSIIYTGFCSEAYLKKS